MCPREPHMPALVLEKIYQLHHRASDVGDQINKKIMDGLRRPTS